MAVKPIPEGYHTINPYFAVRDARKLIEFLTQALQAEVSEKMEMPDGTISHAQLKIGDSMVMVGNVPKDSDHKLMPAMLYMYVADADAVYKRAIQAGGKSVMEPVDQFYGDRSGAFEDPAGNQWWVATRIEDVSSEELMRRSAQRERSDAMAIIPYLLYEDVGGALKFLSKAFGLKKSGKPYRGDDGKINHAAMQLGKDYVMMGYPGPKYKSPRRLGQATQNLYVDIDNVDAHFKRARKAGAKIIEEPVDTFYGARRYGAEDPEGHQWYFAQPLAKPAKKKKAAKA